jgi:hypothetical protein
LYQSNSRPVISPATFGVEGALSSIQADGISASPPDRFSVVGCASVVPVGGELLYFASG